ncbi:Right handed beta helix region [Mucilaginibacter lappiensis]|uniref:Right handed beta helix region n=1 Tax=Mucilaginibacter lappiensis TaxID=354630 RepID=A0ABR6PK30_9SPHI|nr:right-handed parallel beta-helix repeat-containing protein [Mucilaginibacter lappiensis]MBB6110126.1 hypothetical protein [Mucilaginibacter lappiensis]SIR52343.1 Right handed beta helix region [Mucilaginibacter lappiensis]
MNAAAIFPIFLPDMKKYCPLLIPSVFLLMLCYSIPARADKKAWYINPQTGNDQNTGKDSRHAWKTFAPLNQLTILAGEQVNIMASGDFHTSLVLNAKGSSAAHVTINFAPGVYNFYPDGALKKQFQISNTNDVPYGLKAIALYLNNCQFVDIKARGAKIVLRGKMIETCVDHSKNISIDGITYDYYRPTVSELTVVNTGDHFADLKIHPDSKYSIKDSLLTWQGEGWQHKPFWLWQELDLQTGDVQRMDIPVDSIRYAETGNNTVRAYFKKNPGFKTGLIYQNRDVIRDYVGIFMQRSKNISLKNIHINFMHGMGVVSQFCQNILMDRISVRPDPTSGRTCAAWADILHFSGCRGKIEISNSYLSGANDDAINIHGTYLRLTDTTKQRQILVDFKQHQTYGFEAFTPGDSIAFIHADNLQEYSSNVVLQVQKFTDKEYLLMLKNPYPEHISSTDVIENTTWTPEVWIHHDTVARIPTRGILVTSRRKTVIENTVFLHPHMSAISIANDAANWYESGMVKDVTIRNNQFIQCGEPAIIICPENKQSDGPVHQNIAIIDNQFDLQGTKVLSAKSTSGIIFNNNTIKAGKDFDIKNGLELKDCTDVKVSGNTVGH